MKILFITQFLPYPLDNGGAIKTYQTLKVLSQNHEVCLICFIANKERKKYQKILESELNIEVKPVIAKLPFAEFRDIRWEIFKSGFSWKPFIVYSYWNKEMAALVGKMLERGVDAIHIDHLNMASYLPNKKNHLWVLEEHNIKSILNWRNFKQEEWNKFKSFSFVEAVKNYLHERIMIPRFDYCLAISNEDKKKLIKRRAERKKIFFLPTVFENRLHFSFKPLIPTIIFFGDLEWWPNKDGIIWFMKKVFPLIKAQMTNVKLLIIGKRAGKKIKTLVRGDPNIELIGYVPDLEPYLKKAGCFVVPLRTAGGIRIKLLTAMAAGLPIVSTPLGCEGVQVKNRKQVLLADEPKDFAKAVIEVLRNRKLATELSKAGLSFIEKNYCEKEAKRVLRKIYRAELKKQT